METAPRDTDARADRATRLRRRARAFLEIGYVLTVASVAAFGFIAESTAAILGATALALPAGPPALVGYYVAYGLLGQVPGANPDEASGTSCSPGVGCQESATGNLAPWFAHTMDTIGVLALTLAAVANVVLLRFAMAKLRATKS